MFNILQRCQLSTMSAFFLKLCLGKEKYKWHVLDDCRVLAFYLQIAKSVSPFVGLFTSAGE